MEHEPIPGLPDPVPPGYKMTLFGPLIVRRGLIMLTAKNVRARGGFVEELQSEMGLKAALAKRLNRDEDNILSTASQLPTQTYVPKNIPLKYKPGGQASHRGPPESTGDARRRPLAGNRFNRQQQQHSQASDAFGDDDDDLLLASVDLDSVAGGGSGSTAAADDVFGDDDEDDELFSQIQMPSNSPAVRGVNKRRRF